MPKYKRQSSYNLSVRIRDKSGVRSYTTLVVCLDFIREWQNLQFNVDFEQRDFFLRNFFIAGLFILRVFARNLMRENRRRIFFHISF